LLKIHQLFFRGFILIFLGTFVAISVTTYFWLQSVYIETLKQNLTQNINSFIVGLDSLHDLDQKVLSLKKLNNLRITIIDENGVVIAESDKDKTTMDNHLSREEIQNINEKGIGQVIRRSQTVKKEMLNVVKKTIIDDKLVYIRMGDYIDKIQTQFFYLSLQVSSILALFLVAAFIVSYKMSNIIKQQTHKVMQLLSKLAKKGSLSKNQLEEPQHIYTNAEFFEILKLLRKVSYKLSKKEKIKAKHTARLKLANQQKDEIIGAISHEFKNPIAIISGYSETILNDKDLPSTMKESFLKKIYSNANKMAALIDRLRLTLKLEENKQEGFFTKSSVKNLCEEIISDLSQKYKNRTIRIQGDDCIINMDEPLMSIAISNLIENALKYSEDEVVVHLSSKHIAVSDKGMGIAPNELSHIQEKFYRVSKNDWNNSLGLGLFIVLKILKIHDFTLEIKSEIGVGSQFIINFK
jgi:signal transduction histidine kinase